MSVLWLVLGLPTAAALGLYLTTSHGEERARKLWRMMTRRRARDELGV